MWDLNPIILPLVLPSPTALSTAASWDRISAWISASGTVYSVHSQSREPGDKNNKKVKKRIRYSKTYADKN